MSALAQIAVMRRNGIKYPITTYQEAKRTGLPLDIACAMLMQETGGGTNEFGHDPTVAVGWGTVTRAKYRAYKLLRDAHGHGSRCQGVGSVQLTYVGFQDRADALGGCDVPRFNMRVGFAVLAADIRRNGLHAGIASYNGSGAAAQHYADNVLLMSRHWASLLKRAAAAPAIVVAPATIGTGKAGTPQSYLPKAYCWQQKPIQVAAAKRDQIDAFMARHSHLRVYAGFATSGHVRNSDHYCGFATDIVPLTSDVHGKANLEVAEHDAKAMGVPYVELVWTETNKHLHVSWARCPHSTLAREAVTE